MKKDQLGEWSVVICENPIFCEKGTEFQSEIQDHEIMAVMFKNHKWIGEKGVFECKWGYCFLSTPVYLLNSLFIHDVFKKRMNVLNHKTACVEGL